MTDDGRVLGGLALLALVGSQALVRSARGGGSSIRTDLPRNTRTRRTVRVVFHSAHSAQQRAHGLRKVVASHKAAKVALGVEFDVSGDKWTDDYDVVVIRFVADDRTTQKVRFAVERWMAKQLGSAKWAKDEEPKTPTGSSIRTDLQKAPEPLVPPADPALWDVVTPDNDYETYGAFGAWSVFRYAGGFYAHLMTPTVDPADDSFLQGPAFYLWPDGSWSKDVTGTALGFRTLAEATAAAHRYTPFVPKGSAIRTGLQRTELLVPPADPTLWDDGFIEGTLESCGAFGVWSIWRSGDRIIAFLTIQTKGQSFYLWKDGQWTQERDGRHPHFQTLAEATAAAHKHTPFVPKGSGIRTGLARTPATVFDVPPLEIGRWSPKLRNPEGYPIFWKVATHDGVYELSRVRVTDSLHRETVVYRLSFEALRAPGERLRWPVTIDHFGREAAEGASLVDFSILRSALEAAQDHAKALKSRKKGSPIQTGLPKSQRLPAFPPVVLEDWAVVSEATIGNGWVYRADTRFGVYRLYQNLNRVGRNTNFYTYSLTFQEYGSKGGTATSLEAKGTAAAAHGSSQWSSDQLAINAAFNHSMALRDAREPTLHPKGSGIKTGLRRTFYDLPPLTTKFWRKLDRPNWHAYEVDTRVGSYAVRWAALESGLTKSAGALVQFRPAGQTEWFYLMPNGALDRNQSHSSVEYWFETSRLALNAVRAHAEALARKSG